MRFYFLLIILLCSGVLKAQKVKYKDIFPTIQAAEEEQKLMLIKEFLLSEPSHPNAIYLLSKIYIERYKNADLLKEYERAIANADQARGRITQSKLFIDEKEVKRNNEYYLDGDGFVELSFEAITSKLNEQEEKVLLFLEKTPPIYKNFTQSVAYYDKCIKLYAELNGTFNSQDDFLLFYDDEVDAKLGKLKNFYDSTIIHLDKYLDLIKEYPIGRTQQYELLPISVYRMQGLVTRINFLENDIEVWNYGKWVDDMRNIVGSELKSIRADLIRVDKKLDQALKSVNSESDIKSIVDSKIIHELEKYDFQSLPSAVLNFKQFKIDLYKINLRSIYYDTSKTADTESKYIYFSEMMKMSREADSLLAKVKMRNIELKRRRFQDYIDNTFSGANGVSDYVEKEHKQLKIQYYTYVDKLKSTILNNVMISKLDSGKTVKYKRYELPLYTVSIKDIVDAGVYYTTLKKMNPDSSFYMAGMKRQTKAPNNLISFVYKVKDNKVLWLKEFDISIDSVKSDANNFLGAMELTKEGCAILINSRHLASQMAMNTIIYLDENGEQMFVHILEDVESFPRLLKYNEIDNKFIMAFRGESPNEDLFREKNSRIIALNVLGERLWDNQFSYAGNIVDLIPLNDGFIFVSNFTLLNLDGISYDMGRDGSTNAVVFKLDRQGKVLRHNVIENKQSFYFNTVIKASENNINLLGYSDNLTINYQSKLSDQNNLVHLILDSNTDVLASSFQRD